MYTGKKNQKKMPLISSTNVKILISCTEILTRTFGEKLNFLRLFVFG